MNTKTALKMAIEVLSCMSQSRGDPQLKALNACKEALESQEPANEYKMGYEHGKQHYLNKYYKGNSIGHWYNKAIKYGSAIEELWDVLRSAGVNGNGKTSIVDIVKENITAPSQEQEPVAWLWLEHGKPRSAFIREPSVDTDGYWKAKGFSYEPLYTHPCKGCKHD